MRLLNAKTLTFEEFYDNQVPKYTILSHRWEEEEVSYQDFRAHRRRKLESISKRSKGFHKTSKGFTKIEACCRMTVSHGYQYTWIDTCCINKDSSAELTEAINSMYRWYQQSQKCYAYLCDVFITSLDTDASRREFKSSKWFTRGWTLQELIAPKEVLFLNNSSHCLGLKSPKDWINLRESDIEPFLREITAIPSMILCHSASLSNYPIAQRMSWAASRTTTRIEDRAYSLLGIFNVNMPMLYGEGTNAFRRLQEEIIKRSNDTSIFAWSLREQQDQDNS